RLVRDGRPVRVDDTGDSSASGETSILRRGVRSVLVVPLLRDRRVTGAIGLESVTLAGAFTDGDAQLLESVAALLAPYLHVGRRLDAAVDRVARLEASPRERRAPSTIIAASR